MKKLFAIIMSMLMIACFMPTMAFAASTQNCTTVNCSHVAAIGTTHYDTLQEAVSVATAGSKTEIKLLNNATGNVTIDNGVNVEIDLQGHTISATDKTIVVKRGTLTLVGEGIVKENTPNYSPILINSTATKSDTNHANVIIGEKVKLVGWAGVFVNQVNQTAYGVNVEINGEIEAVNDTSGGTGPGVYVNGQIKDTENAPNITIGEKAKIVATGAGIYAAGYANWNLACDMLAPNALSIKSGSFVITGGKYKSTGAFSNPADANGNGSEDTGAALSITSNDGYAKKINVEVLGGEFTSTNGYAIYEGIAFDKDKNKYAAVESFATLAIKGGKFVGNEAKGSVAITTAKNKKVITGGTFSSTLDAAYLSDLVKAEQNADGTYSVVPNENAVAQIGKAYYASLQDAVSTLPNVANGEALPAVTTIKLLKDTNGGFDFGLEKERRAVNAVLDLNGKTLTLAPAIGSKGTETNGIRTLAHSKLEIKNGTLECSAKGVEVTTTNGKETRYTKVAIANYSITTLDNVSVKSSEQVHFTVNNRGELTLKGKTTIEAGKFGTGEFQNLAIANEVYNAYYEDSPLNSKIICDSKDVKVGKMSIEHKAQYKGNPNAQVELNISAGTFGVIWDVHAEEEKTTPIIKNITGGTFSSDPSAYVADNYVAVKSGDTWTVKAKSTSGGGGFVVIPTETPLDKAKTEANTAVSAAASANKYDDAEQAEVKKILDKAAADIKNAKTEEEVKAIQEAAQAEIDKVLTTEEKAQIKAVKGVDKEIFKAKSKYSKLRGKRAIKVTWNVPNGMKFDGFEIYRSTKKFSGYGKTPYFTTTKTSYINNKGLVKGKTYYYKVRAFVIINGEKVYTDYSTKAFRIIK